MDFAGEDESRMNPAPHTEYRGRAITVLDDVVDAAFHAQGYVVGRFGPGWAAFMIDGKDVIVLTGSRPVESQAAAIEALHADIDRWLALEEREQVQAHMVPVPAAPLPDPAADQSPIFGWHNSEVPIPVPALLRVVNSLPVDSEARKTLLEACISAQPALAAGFVVLADGSVAFDEARASMAVYRKKQATRAQAALEQMKKAVDDVLMTNDFLDAEAACGRQLLAGTPLSALPDAPRAIFDETSRVFEIAQASATNVQKRLTANAGRLKDQRDTGGD